MTATLLLLVSMAGAVGSAARFAIDGLIRCKVQTTFPVGTTVINLTGSLLLGLVLGLVGHHVLPGGWQPVAGTGFLGGYTTFSTASFETVRLLEERRFKAALVNGLGTLIVGTGCAALGIAAAALVSSP